MFHSKFIFLTAVVLTLAAGWTVGRLTAIVPASNVTGQIKSPTTQRSGRDAWISQLDLTVDEQQKMDAIWSAVKPKVDKTFEERRSAEKERDDAIQKLIAASDLHSAYDKILTDYHSTRSSIDKERTQLIHDAEEKSRALLSPEQQKKWDVLSQQTRENRNSHRSSTQRSTTRRDDETGSN